MARVVVVGSFIQDLTFWVEALPSVGETRLARLTTGPGGKGSNQAIACRRQGVETLFVGAVGDDPFGRAYTDLARGECLEIALEVSKTVPTGTASIWVDAKSRNMIAVAPGASGELSVDHIERHRKSIESARVFLTQLEANLAATEHALEIARAARALTILNPAPIHVGVTRSLIDLADILTPNETELAFLLQHLHGTTVEARYWEAPDPDLAKICASFNVPTVVLTLGERGCFVAHRSLTTGQAHLAGETRLHYRVPAASVRPVDTTGAGDAFSGALAAALALRPREFRAAVEQATVAAGLSTERPGAAMAMPTGEEVRARRGSPPPLGLLSEIL